MVAPLALAGAGRPVALDMSSAPPYATVVASLGRSVGLVVLLIPIMLTAARSRLVRRDRVLAAAVALGAAVGMLVMAGLVMSSFSGVSLAGWLISLGVIDAVLIMRASRRGLRQFARRRIRPRRRFRAWLGSLLAVAAAGLVVTSVLMSVASAKRQQRQSHFTQLWMVQQASDQPVAKIGVRDLEGGPRSYRLVVSVLRRTIFTTKLRLADSDSWTKAITLPLLPHRELLRAALYRSADRTPYRIVYLWTPTP